MHKGLTLYHGLNTKAAVTQPDLLHEYHWGYTGTGKSRQARERYPDAYIKDANMWWCNYTGQETVIIEDLGPKLVGAQRMKLWTDHYPFTCEAKGSSLFIRPKRIIVTSNYSIREIYEDPRDYEPLERRFKVTHYPQPIMQAIAEQPSV